MVIKTHAFRGYSYILLPAILLPEEEKKYCLVPDLFYRTARTTTVFIESLRKTDFDG